MTYIEVPDELYDQECERVGDLMQLVPASPNIPMGWEGEYVIVLERCDLQNFVCKVLMKTGVKKIHRMRLRHPEMP